MAWHPVTVDSSFEPSTARGPMHLREGNYLFEITGLTPSKKDHTGEPYWRWALRIIDGPEAVGRPFSNIGSWKEGAQFTNATTLQAIGVSGEKLKTQTWPTYEVFAQVAEKVGERVKGRKFGGYVADGDPYNGQPRSNIMEIYAEAEYVGRKASAPVPQATVSGAAPAALSNGQAPAGSLADAVKSLFGDEEVESVI